jgi:hypothetical protein
MGGRVPRAGGSVVSDTEPPALAYSAVVDALETLDYEHAACERAGREVALMFTDPRDRRPVVMFTDRPRCVTREMELAGAVEGRSPIGAG